MLRQNLGVHKGKVNGSIGTVHRIIYSDNPPPSLPSVGICVFQGYTGPSFIQVFQTQSLSPVSSARQQNDTVLYLVGHCLYINARV